MRRELKNHATKTKNVVSYHEDEDGYYSDESLPPIVRPIAHHVVQHGAKFVMQWKNNIIIQVIIYFYNNGLVDSTTTTITTNYLVYYYNIII